MSRWREAGQLTGEQRKVFTPGLEGAECCLGQAWGHLDRELGLASLFQGPAVCLDWTLVLTPVDQHVRWCTAWL